MFRIKHWKKLPSRAWLLSSVSQFQLCFWCQSMKTYFWIISLFLPMLLIQNDVFCQWYYHNDFGKKLPIYPILQSSSCSRHRTPSVWSLAPLSKRKKKKKKSSVSLSVVWADKNHQGFPVPLYSFCINGWIFFVLKLITQEPVGRNLNYSLSSSADTVKCLIVTIPVAGKWNFCKVAFCLKRGFSFWFW